MSTGQDHPTKQCSLDLDCHYLPVSLQNPKDSLNNSTGPDHTTKVHADPHLHCLPVEYTTAKK